MSDNTSQQPLSNTFEVATLRSGLAISTAYQLSQLLRDILTEAPTENFILNSFILVAVVFLYLLTNKNQFIHVIATALHLLLLPVFTFYWLRYNGVEGSVPYFFLIYITFIIYTLRGALRFLVLSLYGLLLTYMLAFPTLFKVNHYSVFDTDVTIGLSIDCFLSATLLSVFFVRVKRRFEKYRISVASNNTEVDHFHKLLESQNLQIRKQKETLEILTRDLHELVQQRIVEIDRKNKTLSEYAFINAHVVRGPLSRVLGLINLMMLEKEIYDVNTLNQIQENAKEIDAIVRKINHVLN